MNLVSNASDVYKTIFLLLYKKNCKVMVSQKKGKKVIKIIERFTPYLLRVN